MKKKYLILLAVILIVINGCDIFNTNFENQEDARMYRAKVITYAPDNPSSLKIMTWNIKFGGARINFFFDGWGDEVLMSESVVIENTQNIADYINEVDPDIILLQELDIDSKRSAYVDQMQYILDATDLNYGAYASQWKADFVPSDGLGRMNSGNAIMSKWRITDAVRIALPLIDQDGLTQYFYLRRNILKTKIVVQEAYADSTVFRSSNFVQRTHYFIEQPTELYELYGDNDGIEGVDYPLGWKNNAIKLANGNWILSQNGYNLLPDPDEELTIYLDDGLASNNAMTIDGVNYIDPEDTYHFDILAEGIDYNVNYDSGIIIMTLPQGVNKIYSIGITYTRNDGLVVGNDSPPVGSPVETKMLRIRNQNVEDNEDYWDLQVRNIYNIGIENIPNYSFDMNVFTMPAGGSTPNYIAPEEVTTADIQTLNEYLRLDSNEDELINGEDTGIDLENGSITFNFIKPFFSIGDSIIYYEEYCPPSDIVNYIAITIKEPARELDVLNIHAAAYSKDGTKKEQIDIYKGELDDLNSDGLLFVAGGDFNAIPPNSVNWLEEGFPDRPDDLGEDYEVEDYDLTDMIEFYADYHPDLHPEDYLAEEEGGIYISLYYTHSIYINLQDEDGYDPNLIDIDWNRKLDYLFTNNPTGWIAGSNETHQDTRQLSDHCPVTVELEW